MKVKIMIIALLMCLTLPAPRTCAQFSSNNETTVQVDETDATVTVDKKKKSDSD